MGCRSPQRSLCPLSRPPRPSCLPSPASLASLPSSTALHACPPPPSAQVYATFPPALAGAREEDFFWFTVRAEKTNGRAAMLGLAVLAALEYHSGFAFF